MPLFNTTIRILVLLSILLFATTPARANVFVHLFEWNWADVATECETYLGPKGFTAVQVSPPQEHIGGSQWWTRYQPVSYEIISRGGDRAAFIDMINRCRAVGVDIYVDAVINHMRSGDTNFPKVPYGYHDFHNWTCSSINYKIAEQVWNCDLLGLKDLKTESEYVRSKIVNYLNDLVSIGVKGFRIDAAKHMPPWDVQNIVSRIHGNPYVFLEVIRGHDEAVRPEHYTHIGNVTEFQMEKDLAWHFRNNQIANLRHFSSWGGRLHSSNAVPFVANHDDQRQHEDYTLTYKDSFGQYYLAHIFMIAYPYGYPKVMSSYKWSTHDQGPPSSGPHTGNSCDINGSGGDWVCEHRWGGIGNMVKFRAVTTPNWYISHMVTDGNNRLGFGRGGLGYVLLNNETHNWTTTVNTGMPEGEYCDVIHGNFEGGACSGPTIYVDVSGNATFSVGQRDAVAIHMQAKLW